MMPPPVHPRSPRGAPRIEADELPIGMGQHNAEAEMVRQGTAALLAAILRARGVRQGGGKC